MEWLYIWFSFNLNMQSFWDPSFMGTRPHSPLWAGHRFNSHWPHKALKTAHQFCFNRQMPKGKIGLQGSSDLSGFCLSLIFWPENSIWCCQIFNVFKRLKNNFFSILSCIQLEVLSK